MVDWILLHINHCRLFNAESSLHIYIKYIWLGLVGFYGISTIEGYSMSNPLIMEGLLIQVWNEPNNPTGHFIRLQFKTTFSYISSSVGWGCRIHQLHLCRGIRLPLNKCLGYDLKQSDGEAPVLLELWGMWGTSSLPLLPDSLWHRVVTPNRVLSMS